jgi:hypothetical protein
MTKAAIGVAPFVELGSTIVRNVVFLVFDDQDLTFADGFQIQGILGLPVIKALGASQFFAMGECGLATHRLLRPPLVCAWRIAIRFPSPCIAESVS